MRMNYETVANTAGICGCCKASLCTHNANQESITRVFAQLAKTGKAYKFECAGGVAQIREDDYGMQKAEIAFA